MEKVKHIDKKKYEDINISSRLFTFISQTCKMLKCYLYKINIKGLMCLFVRDKIIISLKWEKNIKDLMSLKLSFRNVYN